jgi:anti-sigma factor RsiW
MDHKMDKEQLSAFLDDELLADERATVQGHLSFCEECSAYVERLKAASTDFKQFGSEKAPASVQNAAGKKKAASRWSGMDYAMAFTAFIAAMLVGGMMAKKFAPAVFSQIQGMISGAANNLGQ